MTMRTSTHGRRERRSRRNGRGTWPGPHAWTALAAATLILGCAPAEPPEDAAQDPAQEQQAATTQPISFQQSDSVFGQLPDSRSYGAVSAINAAPDGMSMWVAERCGENSCAEHMDLNTVFRFDLDGNVLASFGAGLILWPHGMEVDHEGNVWVTDARGDEERGMGHVIYKFSPEGEVLMTLGTKGVSGTGPDTFNQPSDVLVAPNGDIFVADGHGSSEESNNRIVKFSSDGTFIKEWGGFGTEPGQFRDPHALAMDSQGRLFVGDRANNRVQIFDQDGNFIAAWTQFGRPSGIFIDSNDMIYVADSESRPRTNPDFKRGIYFGSARTGELMGFIPDVDPQGDNAATSGPEGVAVDARGAVYGAEVAQETVRRFVRSGS